jgi:phosphate transport system permease protein
VTEEAPPRRSAVEQDDADPRTIVLPPNGEADPSHGGSATALEFAGEPTGLASGSKRRGDGLFKGLTTGTGAFVLVLIAAITLFLIAKAVPAINKDSVNFLTTKDFNPDDSPSKWGVAALAYGSVISSIVALVLAAPVAIGVALMIAFYAPRRLAQVLGSIVDLLAAVPSVVYGLWALVFLVPRMQTLGVFLDKWLGWIPLFHAPSQDYGRSLFTGGVVLAIMILPIIAAISREVFLQVPSTNVEAALALGATRWEMLRLAVLPFCRPGVTSAVLLGFGRAIGETIAIALVLSSSFSISSHIIESGGNTVAANIATASAEAGPVGLGALIASGLVLFVITLIVNSGSRIVVSRAARKALG